MCKYFFIVLFIYIFTYRNKQNDFYHLKTNIMIKRFQVSYTGNATQFKGCKSFEYAETKKDAVLKVYARYLDHDYFPQEDGNIFDQDNNLISARGDDAIYHDGGYFIAEENKIKLY